jgi:hypothetical protein
MQQARKQQAKIKKLWYKRWDFWDIVLLLFG